MTERSPDAGLEDYLARRSSLSRRYRELEDDAPPPELDARVLAEARRAVEQSNTHRTRSMRWRAPLAVAATVLLTVAVVLEVTQRPAGENAPVPQGSKEQATTPAESAAVSSTPAEAAPARDTVGRESQPPQQTSAPAASVEGRSAPIESGGSVRDVESERQVLEASRAEQTAAPHAGPAAGAERDSRTAAPAEMSSLARETDETVSGDSPAEMSDPQDPEAWLERIEALRVAGRTAEADAELERFRQAFPDRDLRGTE